MRTLLLTLVLLLASAGVAVAQSDVAGQLDRLSAELGKQDGAEYWATVGKIRALGAPSKAALTARVGSAGLAPKARLGLCHALGALGEKPVAAKALLELVGSDAPLAVRLSAADLLGSYGDKSMDAPLKAAMRAASEARLKVAMARTLFRVSRSTMGTFALHQLLKSEAPGVRYEAALALGELGEMVDAARKVLREIEHEPTARGRMARLMLDRDRADRRRYDSRPKKAEVALLEEIVTMLREYHVDGDRFTREELMALAVKGMAGGVDRHSVYWTPKEWKKFLKDITGDYAGIGAYVEFRRSVFTVVSPIYSGPAYKAGIRSGDQILAVEGRRTAGEAIDDIIRRITGTPGTPVKITVYRDGWEKSREMSIVRAKIKVKSVRSAMLPGKLGYIRLDQFGSDSEVEVKAALETLEGAGMKGLIFDLRNNGGGYMLTAQRIADMFLSDGKMIVYSKGKHPIIAPKREAYASAETVYDGPVVMLINDGSASASEILSGALQVHKRAKLVGQRTFGKGTVQQPFKLDTSEGARLKITIAKYYLPDDRCIDDTWVGGKLVEGGIKPDVDVEPKRYASWKNEEYTRIREKAGFKKYIKANLAANQELLVELATNDGRDTKRYPGFDAWYRSLGTKADPQDVREWLRDRVRERAADLRGSEYSHDLLEDRQLQKAVLVLCKDAGVDAAGIKAFKSFVDAFKAVKESK